MYLALYTGYVYLSLQVGLFFVFGWGFIFYLAKLKFGKVIDRANEKKKTVNDALMKQKAIDFATEQENAKRVLAERALTS